MTSTARAAEPRRARLQPALIAGAVLLLAFAALYAFTLDDGLRPGELAGGDLITHQYAQVQARFSNAPGYPLYTLGGWLWFRVGRALAGADNNPIPILSAYSTFWALMALALLYALALRVTRGRWPIAALSVAFFGCTYFFWYYAVTTEQYTSSVAWTLAVVLLAFKWQEARRPAQLYGLALLAGVGLAHQITVLAILPPLVWFVLREDAGVLRRPRLLAGLTALVMLPLLSYAYVYWRGAAHPEWRGAGQWESTLAWFLAFISTGQGRGELTWALCPFFTPEFPALIWREMTWPGLLGGLAGIAALGRRRALLLYATFVIYIVFCWIDRLGNWYQVIMPVYALLTLGLAAGVDWLLRRSALGHVRAAPVLAVLLLAALALYRGILSYPRADASARADDTGLAPGWIILADDPPAGARILGTQAEALALSYLTDIWGARADVAPLTAAAARARFPVEPVLATEAALPIVATEVAANAHYSAVGRTLASVSRAPQNAARDDLAAWRHDFGAELRLVGGKLTPHPVTGERVVWLSWQALRAPVHDWSVSVRLTQAGAEIAQLDRAHPVWGAYPTTRWAPGEVVSDVAAFALPPDAEVDGVTVIVYRQEAGGGFINLDVAHFEVGE